MPLNPKSHFERFLRPILASRFLTISALIHLLIIALFGGKVIFNKYVEPQDFVSEGQGDVNANIPPAPPQSPNTTLPPTPNVSTVPPPPTNPSVAVLATVNNNANPAFAMPLPTMMAPTLSHSFNTAPAAAQNFGSGGGFMGVPGAMSARQNPGKAGAQFGEKPASEQSVINALHWLQSQQNPDGTWGSDQYRGAFTGLALLCFLGHGETPQTSREFGVVVSKAIDALVTEAGRNEGRFSFTNKFDGNPASYQHGICTYAMCEAYTMTRDPRLVPILKQAIDYIVKGQRPDGGWAYSYDLSPDQGKEIKSDTSVSGWQIQALKAANLTGIPGMGKVVQPAFGQAINNMDRVYNKKDGSFGYRVAGDRNYALTGVGVLSKYFWLGRADSSVTEGLKNIRSKDLDYQGKDMNFYAWYYDTQASYQAQGGPWSWWNQRFQGQLTKNQSPDGSWPPAPAGQGEPGGLANLPGGDGPVYRTTLCCLMLEVFYRYLPTSKETSVSSEVHGL